MLIPAVPESSAPDKRRATSSSSNDDDVMAMFAGTVPVPMQVPGPAYGSNDQPWLYAGM